MPGGKKEANAKEILERIEKEGIRWIDIQFLDVPGYLQHVTIPAHMLDEKGFKDGLGKLDGSSIKGFATIYESDMVLVPDPATFALIPWAEHKTARMFADIKVSFGGGRFSKDPRYVAQKAEEAVKSAGFSISYWGPEAEFFVFDSVKLFPNYLSARDAWGGTGYSIESKEAIWSGTSGINTPIRFKEGYYPAPPQDTLQDYRTEVCKILEDFFGIVIDAHHHEVATAGQVEIDMKYGPLLEMADNIVSYKFTSKNIAYVRNMIATFMPKPIFGDNASGMHVHQSLWKNSKNMFYDEDDEYAELSQAGRYYIGGLKEHAKALSAIVSPTTNSYKRLVPGYEAPVYIAWSRRNRSACIRVPVYFKGKDYSTAKRIEYRPPDTSCNPYYAFAAMVAAGLDGIKKKKECGDPVDENIYHLSRQRRKELGIEQLPGSLEEALGELNSDSNFLKGIFSKELLETYAEIKTEEAKQNSIRPTPYEFYMYFDI